jgi:diacylglycerol O-acyltransferase
VNLRPAGTEKDLGNHVSGRLVALNTTVDDPFARLEAMAEAGRQSRNAPEPQGDLLNEIADVAGPALASLAGHVISAFDVFEHVPSVANVILSSVPGPPVPLWCAGERMVRASPMGPLMFNQSLNVTVLGYGNSLEFGLLACARKVPDLEILKMFLEQEALRLLGLDDPVDGEVPFAQ